MNVYQSLTRLLAPLTVSAMVIACGSGSAPPPAPAAQSAPAARNSHQDWPTGDYRSSRAGPSRCPTLTTLTPVGRGARLAACTPRTPIESGLRCAASCRCLRALRRGRRMSHSNHRVAIRPAMEMA